MNVINLPFDTKLVRGNALYINSVRLSDEVARWCREAGVLCHARSKQTRIPVSKEQRREWGSNYMIQYSVDIVCQSDTDAMAFKLRWLWYQDIVLHLRNLVLRYE